MNKMENVETIVKSVRDTIDNNEMVTHVQIEMLCNIIESLMSEKEMIKDFINNVLNHTHEDEQRNKIINKTQLKFMKKVFDTM